MCNDYEMLLFLCYFVVKMTKEVSVNIVRYEPRLKKVWDDFVSEAKNSSFLFRRDFMEYHQDRFEDFSLLLYVNERLTCVFPACVSKHGVSSHRGLTYGGLLVKNTCKFDIFKAMFLQLLTYLKHQKMQQLVIKTLPAIYCDSGNDELAFLHQLYGSGFEANIGSVVYNNEELVFSKSIIRNAKKAVKNGIVIKKTDDFTTFWNDLLEPRLQERFHKKPIHSLDEIIYLKDRFPDNIELYAAFLNDEMIAGTVLFNNKNFVKSQYIGSKSAYNKLGGLDLLHYEIINNLKLDYFDFGTSSINPSEFNESLLAWKEQFGARTIIFPTYTFTL